MKTLRKLLILLAFSLPLILAAASGSMAQNVGSKIVTFDYARITTDSFLGEDITAQLQAYDNFVTSRRAEMEAELNAEGAAIREQENLLSPDAYQHKVEEFQAKAKNANTELEMMRQNLVKASQTAEMEITRHLRPIILQIMTKRGADMVIEKTFVYTSRSGFDITDEIIEALNITTTSFPLRLTQ